MAKSVYVPNFRACREAARLTQQEAAARLGRTPSAVQKWEAGRNSPTMEDIRKLADAYDVQPAAFFLSNNGRVEATGESVDMDIVIDANVFIALSEIKRNLIASQLRQCREALVDVPEDFAEHWIAGLVSCASMVGRKSKRGRQNRANIRPTTSV
jgi:transcriptional regulator with XRE-family HTH domain